MWLRRKLIQSVNLRCLYTISSSKANVKITEMEQYIKKNKVEISIVDLLFVIYDPDYIHYREKQKIPDITLKLFHMLATKINIELLNNSGYINRNY